MEETKQIEKREYVILFLLGIMALFIHFFM